MTTFMRRLIAMAVATTAIAACGPREAPTIAEPAATASSTEPEKLNRLVDEYFERQLELNPVPATAIGDLRYNDRFPNNIGVQWLADALAVEQDYLARARKLDVAQLDEKARLTYDVFVFERQRAIDGAVFPSELMPVNQFFSVPNEFGQMGSGESYQPFANTKQYDDFLKRMDGFAVWVDQAIANMRKGVDQGIVLPTIIVEKTLPQLASFVVQDPKQSLFHKPLEKFPEAVAASDRKRLTEAYLKAIGTVAIPAYARLHKFMKEEYLPKTRTAVGMVALPQGEAWYAYLARLNTTTDLSPTQIHDIGLKEMARIHGEMERVKAQVGFNGTLQEFMRHLKTSPQFVHKSRADLVNGYTALKDRVAAALPRLFAIEPKMPFEVRAVEAYREQSAATGSYLPGLPDGTRPGVFYA